MAPEGIGELQPVSDYLYRAVVVGADNAILLSDHERVLRLIFAIRAELIATYLAASAWSSDDCFKSSGGRGIISANR
jgi:hypothetical protein